uniref:Cilia- and flagella-associated protein 61 N-terminal domain-containing protein n=1 Tax=Trichobilharzia regenti TaxID=157069 RepID=A0AA85K600_TRIRE|nr:unnamed protein product [Trichobilharzia regenti]
MQRIDELFEIRRTNLTDVKQIEELKDRVNLKGFGKISLVKLIERSTFSLCITDSEGVLAGHACFYDYPNGEEFPQDDWISIFSTKYRINNVTNTNSLFVHLLVLDSANEKMALCQMLKSAFNIAIQFTTYFCC